MDYDLFHTGVRTVRDVQALASSFVACRSTSHNTDQIRTRYHAGTAGPPITQESRGVGVAVSPSRQFPQGSVFFSPPGEGGSKNPCPTLSSPRFESRRPDAAKRRHCKAVFTVYPFNILNQCDGAKALLQKNISAGDFLNISSKTPNPRYP